MTVYAPPSQPSVLPLFINSMSPWAARQLNAMVGYSVGTITWVTNQAIFIPVAIPFSYPVNRVFWYNGSTITSSSADFGIYTGDGLTKVYSSGSTTLSGTTVAQYVDNTDFILTPGEYYFAYACNNSTSRTGGSANPTAILQRLSGVLQQATAFPLPSTMASAGAATQAIYPMCGITRTTTGF